MGGDRRPGVRLEAKVLGELDAGGEGEGEGSEGQHTSCVPGLPPVSWSMVVRSRFIACDTLSAYKKMCPRPELPKLPKGMKVPFGSFGSYPPGGIFIALGLTM